MEYYLWKTGREKNTECLALGNMAVFLDDLSVVPMITVVSGHIRVGGMLVTFIVKLIQSIATQEEGTSAEELPR